MAVILVNSTAGLTSALKTAQGGDTIKLASGSYDGLKLSGLSYSSNVTITSLDATKPAVITDFQIRGVSNLTFSNVEMATLNHADLAAKGVGFWSFGVRDANNITFDGVKFHGSLDGNVQNDVQGLSILDSNNIVVKNSEFQQLERALAIGNSNNIKVVDNYVHDMRSDGFNFAQVGNVQVVGNTFRNFFPKDGDHPDAIQFWTSGTTKASHDILVSQNVILRGTGDGYQGIFFRDQVGTLPFEHVTISDNLVIGTGYNALRVNGAKDLTVTNNELVSIPGDANKSYMYVQNADGVVSTGNSAISIGYDKVTNLAQSGNSTTSAVGDGGQTSLDAWMAEHPEDAALLKLLSPAPATGGVIEAAPVVPGMTGGAGADNLVGDGKANLLQGFAGNDTLDGMGGADTLAGGTGDDTYYVYGSVVVEKAGEGIDTVIARGEYTLGDNLENLVINNTVTNSWAGIGNALDNKITGNAGNNRLEGMAGNDTLDGGAGGDILIGGAGSDFLTGGTGADIFRFAPGGGKDVVADFGYGVDRDVLDVSAYFKAGMKATVSEVDGNAVVSFTNGDSITLLGVHANELGAPSQYGWVF